MNHELQTLRAELISHIDSKLNQIKPVEEKTLLEWMDECYNGALVNKIHDLASQRVVLLCGSINIGKCILRGDRLNINDLKEHLWRRA